MDISKSAGRSNMLTIRKSSSPVLVVRASRQVGAGSDLDFVRQHLSFRKVFTALPFKRIVLFKKKSFIGLVFEKKKNENKFPFLSFLLPNQLFYF